MDTPIENLVPRTQDPETKATLLAYSEGIKKLVNFGSHVLWWDIDKQREGDHHLPPVLFLRNFLEQLESIGILIQASAVEPCQSHLRTAWENQLYIRYILQEDSVRRGLAFLYWNAIQDQKILERVDPETNVHKQLKSIYKKDKLLSRADPPTLPDVRERIQRGKDLLDMKQFEPIRDEYERLKDKQGKEPNWYTLFSNRRNLSELAQLMNMQAQYEVLYRIFSTSVHGVNIIQGKLVSEADGNSAITQILDPSQAKSLTANTFNTAIDLYTHYIRARIPEKDQTLKDWYLSIRPLSMSLR